MAKRRRLEAPSVAELQELEAGFARETSGPGSRPPIAQVAADAAALAAPQPAAERAVAARDAADAARYREAASEGLLVLELPLNEIVADELARDRMRIDGEEMEELRASIRAHGLRLPIEVFELEDAGRGERYGLISGWRRLAAMRGLHGETGAKEFATIRALVRRPADVAASYVSMVEENEIRAELSQYERGRIAVLAADQGAFASVEAAVDELFHAASKSKRSKIRSFALIHEELGDMLSFAPSLSERAGLRLAQALRAGFAAELRQALATGQGVEPALEWEVMEPLVLQAEAVGTSPARGGRPKARRPAARRESHGEIALANGISIQREVDERGYSIRFHGRNVDAGLIETVMLEIQRLLEPI